MAIVVTSDLYTTNYKEQEWAKNEIADTDSQVMLPDNPEVANLLNYRAKLRIYANLGNYKGVIRPVLQTLAKTNPPILQLTNIAITNTTLHGTIYWVAENTAMVITGNVALPDGDYMLMAERVVDATQVVDDARFIATVLAGVMTINVTFKSTGNYKFSAARLNRGLDRIAAGVHLAFDDIEFDVYV